MVRDKRIRAVKSAAKRHGLHAQVTDEPMAGLIMAPGSRVVSEVSGMVHNCHIRLQHRRLNAHLEDRSATVIQLEIPMHLYFLISDNQKLLEHTKRTSHSRTHKSEMARHRLLYRDLHDDAQLQRLDKLASLLPDKWNAQASGTWLYLFRLPAVDNDDELEEMLRTCETIRGLFVAA